MDERIALDENFPLTNTRKAENLRQLNFRMDDYMKYRVFDELWCVRRSSDVLQRTRIARKHNVGNYKTEPVTASKDSTASSKYIAIALYTWSGAREKADMEGANNISKGNTT